MLLHENNQLPDINSFFAENKALPESENLQSLLEYRKLIQTSLDGFWVVRTKDARILEANDAFCNIVGYSREELLTMSISDLEIDESPAETAAHIKKVMEVGRDRFETRHRHKQGRLVDLEVSVSHSELDGGTNYVFARDITVRKRTEDTLYFIAQRGWMGSAENFFDALAQYLGVTLGVDYVVIDRLDKSPCIADTVALYAKGAIVPNMHYDLKGTPCENVMGRKFCFYSQGVQKLFPDDALLVEMGVESYAGIPLWDSAGQPIGLIAVMGCKPLCDEASISRLLQLVAIRAAAELERERELEFRTLAENMPDNIVRYNRDGVTVYVNPALERTLGDFAAAMIGTTPREYYPDGSYEDYAQLLDTVLASGEAGELEKILPGPDGKANIHQIRMVPERGENGEVVGALSIGRDITERKLIEEQLRLKEFALDQAHEAVYLIDRDLRFVYVNEEACRALGYHRDELLGLSPSDIDPDTTPEDARRIWEKMLAEGQVTFETCHRRRDGSRFAVEIRGALLEYRGQTMNMALVRDITERKRMEEEIAVREREFRSLAENMPDNISRWDTEGRYLYINPVHERTLGVSASEIVGTKISDRHNHIKASIAQVAATGLPTLVRQSVPVGSEMQIHEISLVPERDGEGRIVSVLGLGRDMTALYCLQDELAASERQFRTLAQNSPDSIYRYDRDYRRLFVNQTVCKIVGKSAEELIGSTIDDGAILISEQGRRVMDAIDSVFESGEIQNFMVDFIDQNGEHHDYHMLIVPEHDADGCVANALGFTRNVSDIRKLERRQSQYFSMAPGLFSTVEHRVDGSYAMRFVSDGVRDLYDLEPEDVLRDIGVFVARTHPDDVEMLFRKTGESECDLTPYHVEYRIIHPGKGLRWIECNSIPQRMPNGSTRWAGFYHDITERKHTEQQLRELTAHLLTVREEEKARLAREIHDDLGSTLAALNLRLSHLLDVEFSEDMKKMPLFARLESMSKILKSAIAATRRIITDMRPDVLDNLGLFAALKWQARQFHKHTGIDCRIICADDQGCVDCKGCEYQLDKTLSINLFRIFQESLTNVARHSGASRVEAEYRTENDQIFLTISDNGCGLPEGHTPASTSFGVRGMRERVGQLGGQIKFDSPPGGGFSVMVRLPLLLGKEAGD